VKRHHTHGKGSAAAPEQQKRTKRRVSLFRCLLMACMAASAGGLFAASNVAIDIAAKSLTSAKPPAMVNDVLVLSFKPSRPIRFVGARFAHEGWSVLHPYAVNQNGVFVLDYPVPEGLREIAYRIVADGLWMADPANPQVQTDQLGTEFSVFTLEKEPVRPIINPRQERDGSVTFVFHGTPGRRVSIAGDFNNWDPFMDSLSETAPGTYAVTLRVPVGRHWYFFFFEGRRVLDMFNSQTGVDPDGNRVSYFSLPS
jgi:hypothetical protein